MDVIKKKIKREEKHQYETEEESRNNKRDLDKLKERQLR